MAKLIDKFWHKSHGKLDHPQDDSWVPIERPKTTRFHQLENQPERSEQSLAPPEEHAPRDQEVLTTQVEPRAAPEKFTSFHQRFKQARNVLRHTRGLVHAFEAENVALQAEKAAWKAERATLEAAKATLEAENDTFGEDNIVLEMRNEALEAVGYTLRAKNETLQGRNDILEARNHTLEADNNMLEGRNDISEAKISVLEAKNDTLGVEKATLETDYNMLKAEYADSKYERGVSQQNVDVQNEQIEMLDIQIRAAQRRSFQTLESPDWAPDTTEHTSRKLMHIQDSIKRWSQKHASAEILREALIHPDSRVRLFQSIQEYVHLQDGHLPRGLELHNANLIKTTSTILLSGLVSHRLFKSLLGNPFFFAPEHWQATLSDILQGTQMSDKAGSHAWRCQMLRLLDPPISVGGAGQEDKEVVKRLTRKLVDEVADKLVKDILTTATGLLLTSSDASQSKARDEMYKIVNQAAELAYRMWTQKQHIELIGLARYRQLPENLKFSACTDVLDEHPLHRHELAKDPQALDGRNIGVIISPAIALFGDAHAQDYSVGTRNMLKKAVVWMESALQPQEYDEVMEDA